MIYPEINYLEQRFRNMLCKCLGPEFNSMEQKVVAMQKRIDALEQKIKDNEEVKVPVVANIKRSSKGRIRKN